MGKIFCFLGKSASGKDTIFQELLRQEDMDFSTIIPYTTRPVREGERDGVEYHFCSQSQLDKWKQQGRIIELRSYQTMHGTWTYFTPDDGQIKLECRSYFVIGTLESYLSMKEYFGNENIVPIYIETEDGLRLSRALKREQSQKEPRYSEMCRRFLADEADFSAERLLAAGVTVTFKNSDMMSAVLAVKNYIMSRMKE